MCACHPSSGDAECIHEYTGRTSLTTGVGRPEHGKRWKQVTPQSCSLSTTHASWHGHAVTHMTHTWHTYKHSHIQTHTEIHTCTLIIDTFEKSVDGHISYFVSPIKSSIETAEKRRNLSWLKAMVGKAGHISSFLGRSCTRPHLLT